MNSQTENKNKEGKDIEDYMKLSVDELRAILELQKEVIYELKKDIQETNEETERIRINYIRKKEAFIEYQMKFEREAQEKEAEIQNLRQRNQEREERLKKNSKLLLEGYKKYNAVNYEINQRQMINGSSLSKMTGNIKGLFNNVVEPISNNLNTITSNSPKEAIKHQQLLNQKTQHEGTLNNLNKENEGLRSQIGNDQKEIKNSNFFQPK